MHAGNACIFQSQLGQIKVFVDNQGKNSMHFGAFLMGIFLFKSRKS
jgi:hypothetical protein